MKIRRPSSRDAAHCRERDSLQPGESLAAAGVAEPDRQLVVDEPAAAIGEDGWPIGQARPVLLAAVDREPSDQAALRGDGGRIAAVHQFLDWAEGIIKPSLRELPEYQQALREFLAACRVTGAIA